jgi:hypothetical protein
MGIMLKRLGLTTMIAASLAFLALSPAIAKGNGNNSVALLRSTSVTDSATSSDPNFGEQVTFAVTSTVAQPYVLSECFQSGTRVYAEVHGFYSGYPWGQTYTLGPTQMWSGGSARCTAKLIDYGHNGRVLADTSFNVNG